MNTTAKGSHTFPHVSLPRLMESFLFLLFLFGGPVSGFSATSAPLMFTITAAGQSHRTLSSQSGRVHRIAMNFSGPLYLRPSQIACDPQRFLSDSGALSGAIRIWGTASATGGGMGSETLNFDESVDFTWGGTQIDSRFTPRTADYLYMITRDAFFTAPNELTIYGYEYVSSFNLLRVWVALPRPFTYDAQYEHYDFPAAHMVSGESSAPSCLIGRVVDSDTEEPLAGASVIFRGVPMMSDARGYFRYGPIPPGHYGLEIRKPGYLEFNDGFNVSAFSILKEDFLIVPNTGFDGTVVESKSRVPVTGASVSLSAGRTILAATETDSSGRFRFARPPDGSYSLVIGKTGYASTVVALNLPRPSSTSAVYPLTLQGDVTIVAIHSQYPGFPHFLDGAGRVDADGHQGPFSVTFEAITDWGNYTPDFVEFRTPGITNVLRIERTRASFDVDRDFGVGGSLSVVAVAREGPRSVSRQADFVVMPSPISPGIDLSFVVQDKDPGFVYDATKAIPIPILGPGLADYLVPDYIPIFGGSSFAFIFTPQLACRIDHTGRANFRFNWGLEEYDANAIDDLIAKGEEHLQVVERLDELIRTGRFDRNSLPKVSTAGCDIELFPLVGGQMQFDAAQAAWRLDHLSAGIGGKVECAVTKPFLLGPWPAFAKLSGQVSGEGLLHLTNLDPLSLAGSAEVHAVLRGSIGAGFSEILSIEGWAEGRGHLGFHWPDKPIIRDRSITVSLGYTAYAFLWIWEQGWNVWRWPPPPQMHAARENGKKIATPVRLQRDYVANENYACFLPSKRPIRKTDSTGEEPTASDSPLLQSNVFPYSEAHIASRGTHVTLVWLHDDPVRTDPNRTVAVYSTSTGQTWTEPAPVDDDGTADFHPKTLVFEDGSALFAWANTAHVLDEDATVDEAVQNLEIATAFYDNSTATWHRPGNLTRDMRLDRNPKLAGSKSDNCLLTWIANDHGDLLGGGSAPNQVLYSKWDGNQWTEPKVVATIPFPVLKTALAYDGMAGYLVLGVDADDDLSSVEGRELLLLEYRDGRWHPVKRLTHDQVPNENPHVVIDPDGQVVLTWLRGSELSLARGFDLEQRQLIRSMEYSSNLADFQLAMSSDRTLAITWIEPAAADFTSDLWTIIFDPFLGVWGAPQRLTEGRTANRGLTAAFSWNNTLNAVFNGIELPPVSLVDQVDLADHGRLSGAAHLYLSRHKIETNLVVEPKHLRASPANPVPQQRVILSTRIVNNGARAVENPEVAFLVGDELETAAEIGRAAIADVLVPGEFSDVEIYWDFPQVTRAITVFAVVDPDQVLGHWDRANSVAAISLGQPDPAIESVTWNQVGADTVRVAVRIRNRGPITSQSARIEFSPAEDDRFQPFAYQVQPLEGGEATDITADFNMSGAWLQSPAVIDIQLLGVQGDFDHSNNAFRLFIHTDLRFSGLALSVPTSVEAGAIHFEIHAETGYWYLIEMSEDLRDWRTLTHFFGETRVTQAIDVLGVDYPGRFYRARRAH